MNIKPSASIRQNYNDIAELCRSTGEPVYLTKNGEGDLVVMDINSFTKREKMLKLREELLAVEEDRLHGAPDYSVDEVASMMDQAIRENLPCRSLKTNSRLSYPSEQRSSWLSMRYSWHG